MLSTRLKISKNWSISKVKSVGAQGKVPSLKIPVWNISAFTWVFYETRNSRGYQQFWPCDLDISHEFDLLFENFNVGNNF